MAMRKPRTNGRLAPKGSQQLGVAERDEDGGDRGGKPRKRKLSDMLGPPWSKDDLELFYQAYRKNGKDWKKVAGSMQKRTMEMVETLYGMNRAYLSLPEGATSAEGLIAMMTDHYNLLDESEEESSEEFGTSDRSHQMQSRSRTRAAIVSNISLGPPGYGGPSPAKKPRSAAAGRPWVVGKRTPRYPVGNIVEQKGKNKLVLTRVVQGETSDEDNDMTKEEEVVALTLVTASQQPPSPLISKNTPTRRYSRVPLQNGHLRESSLKAESVKAESGGSFPKHTASTSGEIGPEGSQESMEKPRRANADESELANGARGPASDGKGRWKKSPAKKVKVHQVEVKFAELNGKFSHRMVREEDTEEDDEDKHFAVRRKKQQSTQKTKKRSRQLFSGEHSSGLDALATLADMSANGLLPSPKPRSDSETEEDNHQRSQLIPQNLKGTEKSGKEIEKREEYNKVHEDERSKEQGDKEGVQVASGPRQQSVSPQDSRKRKRKSNPEKIGPHGKSGADEHGPGKTESEVPLPKVESPGVLKPRRKPKRIATTKAVSKQGVKVNKSGDAFGLDLELSVQGAGPSGTVDEGTLPLKIRSKKKGVAEKGPINGFGDVSVSGFSAEIGREPPNCPHATAELGPFNTKARLTHCLSPKVRRWCMYEWFYSAIDLPWFANNEFVHYLNHAGLGHVPRLTRVEWGVVRSSLGKPRRLSKNFLQEEREKLAKYRENVRTHYHELRGGLREGLPPDLARPLTVGQRVIARHPKTRQIHDGSILTVDRSRCRVQFDRPELGVEFVLDIDAMPVHPLENMPEMMRRRRIILDVADRPQGDPKLEAKSRIARSAGGAARAALNERLERPGSIPGVSAFSNIFLNNLSKCAQTNTVESVRLAKAATSEAVAATKQALITQPYTPGQSQARESDIRALAELDSALTKKEPLVVELRRMNEEGPSFKGGSDHWKQQYSSIILQVKDVNDEVLNALKHLRQRNRYQDSVVAHWHRGSSQVMTVSGGPGPGEGNPPGPPEAGTASADITTSSKKHARAMVSVAVQSMSALQEGEDPLAKMGGALELVTKATPSLQGKITGGPPSSTLGLGSVIAATPTPAGPESSAPVDANGATEKPSEVQRAVAGDNLTPKIEDTTITELLSQASPGEVKEAKEAKEAMVLTDLMASCVATLLMVQTLTERQFPAPDVALTLDCALESLRPQAAQNHCIFKEIEQQFGYIKSQILAQIPIQSSVPFSVEVPIAQANPT